MKYLLIKLKLKWRIAHIYREFLLIEKKATTLAAPISGFMDGRIDESMKASIEVELYDKKKKRVLLKDTGKSAGIEVAGKYEMLIK